MRRFFRVIGAALALACALVPTPGRAAGSIPVALNQQVDGNGRPLNGCLLYIYVVGTVAQPQIAYQDTGLSLPLPWPVQCDANGRLPMFYLADGSVKVTLTDSSGRQQFSYPQMLVIGPSGGGGGGSTVDPSTIASTGDVKFRPSSESLSGWVRLNGLTIGSATSGATGRANSDVQSLYVYLWTNCDNTHCPVSGGRGASGLADFSANKAITLPDWRGRLPVGLDDMGNSAAGRFSGVPFNGADTATTPFGGGGENTHTQTIAEMPAHNHTISDPGHTHTLLTNTLSVTGGGSVGGGTSGNGNNFQNATGSSMTGITINNTGGGAAANNMPQFLLGSWYMRL